jgi:hypothetical protein
MVALVGGGRERGEERRGDGMEGGRAGFVIVRGREGEEVVRAGDSVRTGVRIERSVFAEVLSSRPETHIVAM